MPELLAWIAKSRLKQGKTSLEIARLPNLAKPKDNFSGFSDNLLANGKQAPADFFPQASQDWCGRGRKAQVTRSPR